MAPYTVNSCWYGQSRRFCAPVRNITAFLLLSISLPLFAQSMPASLQVDVTGVRTNTGTVVSSICKQGEAFPSKCSITARAPARQGVTALKLDHLAPGRYAMALFHDENNDGQMDLIREGIGFSNNANRKWAPPNFNSSAFTVNGSARISVQMWYQR